MTLRTLVTFSQNTALQVVKRWDSLGSGVPLLFYYSVKCIIGSFLQLF